MIASRYVVVSSVRGTRNAQRRPGSRGSLGISLYEGRAAFLPPGPPGEMTVTGAAHPLTDIQLPGTPYALPSESHVGCILSLHFLIRRTCNPRTALCPCLTVGSFPLRHRCPIQPFTSQGPCPTNGPSEHVDHGMPALPTDIGRPVRPAPRAGVSRVRLTGSPVQGQRGKVRLPVGPRGDITHSQRRRIGSRSVALGVGWSGAAFLLPSRALRLRETAMVGELDVTVECAVARERRARGPSLGIGRA